jgi:NTP pyrophosphatase (non-canonical NTP hydrolase)
MTNQQIRDIIGRPAAVEQLAEECVELAHALLKYARALRGQNPTPVTMEEAWEKFKGEFSDVLTCAEVAGLQSDLSLMWEKRQRWIERLQEAKKE